MRGPPLNTLLTPICFTSRMASSVRSWTFMGAQIFGVSALSWGMPGPGVHFSSACAAAGLAAGQKTVEQAVWRAALLEIIEAIFSSSPLKRAAQKIIQG